MKLFRVNKIVYLLVIILFLFHQLLEFNAIHISILDNYLDAFLFPIIVMPLVLEEKRLILRDKNYRFSILLLIVYILLMIITSEVLFPYLSNRFYFDIFDVLAICLGMVVFHLFFNRELNK